MFLKNPTEEKNNNETKAAIRLPYYKRVKRGIKTRICFRNFLKCSKS